jgi:hypothetical protein
MHQGSFAAEVPSLTAAAERRRWKQQQATNLTQTFAPLNFK